MLCGFGSSGSQAHDNSIVLYLALDHVIELQVSRSEVVGPFRGTMDFVDADHCNFSVELREVLYEEPLRRNKQHF